MISNRNPILASTEATASHWIARRDGGLTPAEKAEFARWLADPGHAAAFARQERTWQAFDRPFRSGEGPELAREFRARLARRRRRRLTAGLAATAACVLVATVALLRKPPASEPPGAIAAGAARTAILQPETRTLPDGSGVEMRAGAVFDVRFDQHVRRIELRRGEAHFQVLTDPARPFVVAADGVEVRAVGTAFSVERGERTVAVVVTAGRVAVEKSMRSSGAALPGSVAAPQLPLGTLAAGEGIVVALAADASSPPRVTPLPPGEIADRLSWRAPRLEFTGAPLVEAVELMNRHGTLQFEIADPATGRLEVSGFFRADNSEAFLRLIEKGLGVRADRQGDTVVLRRAP